MERARVTRILSNIKKSQGDISAATDILCELQVETFGSMSRREKTEFILEQVTLCIENGDWVQAGILSRKISTRYFARKPKKTPEELEKEGKEREEKEKKRSVDDPPPEPEDDVTDLKLRYYELQIILAKHEDKYLEACKYYREVLDTEAVENDPDKLKAVRPSAIPLPSPPHRNILTLPPVPPTHHLLHHPRPPRQRTIRPPTPHRQRLTALATHPHRRRHPQTLHRARADAMADGSPTIRAAPVQHRRLRLVRIRRGPQRGRVRPHPLARPAHAGDRAQRAGDRALLHAHRDATTHAAAGFGGRGDGEGD